MPTGSVQSAKGEASDEDEETEYFDAMEDAPAFITVTADPKHHRYEPPPRGHGSHGATWQNLLWVQEEQGREVLLALGLGAASPPAGSLCAMSHSTQDALPCAPLRLHPWSQRGEDGASEVRMALAIARKGSHQDCAAVKLGSLPPQLMWARGEPGQGCGGKSQGAPGRSGEHLALVGPDLLLYLFGCLSALEAAVVLATVTPPGSLANGRLCSPCLGHPTLSIPSRHPHTASVTLLSSLGCCRAVFWVMLAVLHQHGSSLPFSALLCIHQLVLPSLQAFGQ